MIETPSLLFRKFESSDRELVIELLKNSEFMAYSPTGAMSYELAESRVLWSGEFFISRKRCELGYRVRVSKG